MLSAEASERGKRLATKAQQGRPTASIDKLLPAGTVDLDQMPVRGDFAAGATGDAAWAAAVDGATESFSLCQRQTSTAIEHVSYMIEWQRWLSKEGFGLYVQQVYPLAYEKHGRRQDSVRVRATARGVEGTKLSSTPMEWPADKQRAIRNESKLLLEVHAYPSQFVRYEPVGRGGARTKAFADGRGGGWYIKKGELMQVTDTSRCGEGVLEVRCPNLLNQPYADIPMEELKLQVDVERGCKRWVTIRGLPVAYDDIGTIYGDQGSENDNVHLHCGKLKPKRNLVYTGATRARKRLKISGLADEQDVRLKMGLHPKSIVYQAELGDSFAPGVVEAARDQVAAMAVGDLHLRQAGAVLALAP